MIFGSTAQNATHQQVGYAITRLPEDFKPHKQIRRVYDQRRKMIETGEGIDWAMAEALAFGTLLSEGARWAVARAWQPHAAQVA